MTLKSGTGQACAACKYQRRRCMPECLLAPYFPADEPKMFQNVHRLFGVKHVQHLLKEIPPTHHAMTMKSVKYHATMRAKHPVLGCVFDIQRLQYQINIEEHELQAVLQQLAFFKQQQPNLNEYVSPFQLGIGGGQQENSDPNAAATYSVMTPPHVSFSNNPPEYGFELANYNDDDNNKDHHHQNSDGGDVQLWFQQACNSSSNNSMLVQSQFISSQALCVQEEITQDYNEMHSLLDQIDDRRSNDSS